MAQVLCGWLWKRRCPGGHVPLKDSRREMCIWRHTDIFIQKEVRNEAVLTAPIFLSV